MSGWRVVLDGVVLSGGDEPSVVAATNLLPNGGFNAGVDGWNPNLAPVITWNAGTLEASGNGTSSGLSAITTATAWGVTAGQTVYCRARVRSVSGQTPTGTVARFGFGATNVSVDPVGWAPGSDGWVDLRFSAVVPSDVTAATACRVNVGARLAANAQVSDRIQIDDVIVSTVDTPFFDGDTPDTNTVSYSWTGTAPTNVPGSWTNGSFSSNVAGWSAYQGAAAPVWRAGGFLTSPGNNTATSNYVVSDAFAANFQSGQVLTMRPRFKLEGGKAFTVFVCRILLGSTIVGSGDRTLANLGVTPDAEGFYNPGIPITIGAGVTPGAQVRIVVGVAGLPSNATASDLLVLDTVAGTVETAGSPSERVPIQIMGCLTQAPDGMGLPNLRTEDVTYAQRDGVRHFNDWYDPRIITLENVKVCSTDCQGCGDVRTRVRDILMAWRRRCDDTELVIWPDCDPTGDPTIDGPFGVVGRPRVASATWERPVGRAKCATLLLRFDSVDHRLYVLDPDGTPGSGAQCVTLTPETSTKARCYPRCYPMCYDTDTGDPGAGPVDAVVTGTVCVGATITLNGLLTNPRVENITTGDWVGYDGIIRAEDPPVIINTQEGTATQGGESRTHLLSGTPRMELEVGTNTLRLTSFGTSDTGTSEVCWRPQAVMV